MRFPVKLLNAKSSSYWSIDLNLHVNICVINDFILIEVIVIVNLDRYN